MNTQTKQRVVDELRKKIKEIDNLIEELVALRVSVVLSISTIKVKMAADGSAEHSDDGQRKEKK